MSDEINRLDIRFSGHGYSVVPAANGHYMTHSDHLAAIAEKDAVIDRLVCLYIDAAAKIADRVVHADKGGRERIISAAKADLRSLGVEVLYD